MKSVLPSCSKHSRRLRPQFRGWQKCRAWAFAVHVEAASADEAYGMIGILRNMCMGMRVPSCHMYLWTMPTVIGYSRANGSVPFTNQVAEFSVVADVVSLFMDKQQRKHYAFAWMSSSLDVDNQA